MYHQPRVVIRWLPPRCCEPKLRCKHTPSLPLLPHAAAVVLAGAARVLFPAHRAALPVGAVPRSPVPLFPGSRTVGHAKFLYQVPETHQEAARLCSQHHRLSPLASRLSPLASCLLLSCPASFTQQRPSTIPGFPLCQQRFSHQPNRLCGSCLKCLDSDPQPQHPPTSLREHSTSSHTSSPPANLRYHTRLPCRSRSKSRSALLTLPSLHHNHPKVRVSHQGGGARGMLPCMPLLGKTM